MSFRILDWIWIGNSKEFYKQLWRGVRIPRYISIRKLDQNFMGHNVGFIRDVFGTRNYS